MNTIIEKIRAEVNRQAKSIDTATGDFAEGRRMEQRHILFFLSDLEKEEKPTIQEQPVKIDIRKELASIEFMGVNDARDTETIARHFYALGQQSKEQPVCEDAEMEIKETELEYQQRSERGEYPVSIESICRRFYELGRQSKPKVSEGLEEEIQKYMSERWEFGCINPTTPVYLYDFTTDELKECARHFAEWGAEHRGSSETPKDLEEAAVEYSAIGYSPFDDPYEKNQQFECSKFAFIDGAKWQKEQMMKEAVVCEAEVCKLADRVWVTPTDAKKLQQDTYNNFKAGDKVRIIICKKED